MAVYVVIAGVMIVFVYAMIVLGMVGNGIRRMLPSARPVMRLLRSWKFSAVAAWATFVAAHLETFSLPPTFRETTLKGERVLMPEDTFLALRWHATGHTCLAFSYRGGVYVRMYVKYEHLFQRGAVGYHPRWPYLTEKFRLVCMSPHLKAT